MSFFNPQGRKCSVCGKLFTPRKRTPYKQATDEDFICSEMCIKERNEATLGMSLPAFGGGPNQYGNRAAQMLASGGRVRQTEAIRKRESGK